MQLRNWTSGYCNNFILGKCVILEDNTGYINVSEIFSFQGFCGAMWWENYWLSSNLRMKDHKNKSILGWEQLRNSLILQEKWCWLYQVIVLRCCMHSFILVHSYKHYINTLGTTALTKLSYPLRNQLTSIENISGGTKAEHN